jgi:branched-chain amino acid aminotransferase
MGLKVEGMAGLVAIDGQICPADQATVPVFDRGFLYGDSVYEVIRTYGGKPFALDEHLDRLARSAARVDIPLPFSAVELAQEIHQLLHAAGAGEWYVRLILTRGGGPIGLDPALADQPRRVVIVAPLEPLAGELREKGVAVVLVPVGRSAKEALASGAKTGNYLTNIMALRRAREGGGFEAVLVDSQGFIAEGSSSNVFVVDGNSLRTPPLATGILDGITRRKVLSVAEKAGLEVRQEPLRPLDLYSADEVFITGTVKEVLAVTEVDGKAIGEGRPGPVSRRLGTLFQELVAQS